MIKFEHPGLFWFFIVILFIITLIILRRKSLKKDLDKFTGTETQDKLLKGFNKTKRKLKIYLLIFALIFLWIAVIGPKIGKTLKKVDRKGVDLVLAFDVSNSMNAEDLAPSR